MVIPEEEQQARKKRRQANPEGLRRSNANDVTVNMLSKQGRHRYNRGPPHLPSTRETQHSEGEISSDEEVTSVSCKKRRSKKKTKVSSNTEAVNANTKGKHSKRKKRADVLPTIASVAATVAPTEEIEPIDPEVLRAKLEYQYQPSHIKVASVIAKCLPHRDAQTFLRYFNGTKPNQARTEEERNHRDAVQKAFGCCCKTPIWNLMVSLKLTFGESNVDFRRMRSGEYIAMGSSPDAPKTGKVSLKFYLLDCIVDRRVCVPDMQTKSTSTTKSSKETADNNQDHTTLMKERSLKVPRRIDRGDINETVWKVPCKCESDLEADNDYKFVHAITVVPDAMIFYTYMERYEDPSLSVDMSLIPMGISWLRLLGTKQGWFAKGGYIRYLSEGDDSRKDMRSTSKEKKVSAWIIEIFTDGPSPEVCRLRAFQTPDLYGPRWPPDIFPSNAGYVADDPASRRAAYLKLFNQSQTTRIGAKWHVPGTRYNCLSPSALLIIPKKHGPHDITVSIQRSDDEILGNKSRKSRDISPVCESVVSIRYLDPSDATISSYLKAITRNAETVRQNSGATVRNNSGDRGAMYALGCRVDPDGRGITEYAGNKHVSNKLLPNAVEAMEYIGSSSFPSIMRSIQDMERAAGCECLSYMEKIKVDDRRTSLEKATQEEEVNTCRVGLTMDISANLCNSAHYDVNDATTGYAVWTESIPENEGQKWYFVLPNVIGKRHDDTTYEGVAIQLEHGVAISWDGRRIKHCSFYVENSKHPYNFLYGTFCGSKYNLINLGLDGKGQVFHEPDKEPESGTTVVGPSVASMPTHDASDDDTDHDVGFKKPNPKKPAKFGLIDEGDKKKKASGHGRLSEPIPKKPNTNVDGIDKKEARKVAPTKKSSIVEDTLDYATMRARCFTRTTVVGPSVASMPTHDASKDDTHNDVGFKKPNPKKPAKFGVVNEEDDKKAASMHGRLAEPIPKKPNTNVDGIDKKEEREVAPIKKSSIVEETLDQAAMTARCFTNNASSQEMVPCWVIEVTRDRDDNPAMNTPAPAPTDVAVQLHTKTILPEPFIDYETLKARCLASNQPPPSYCRWRMSLTGNEKMQADFHDMITHPMKLRNLPSISEFDWWTPLNHKDKLKFLYDNENYIAEHGRLLSYPLDWDLILQQTFPKYVLSPLLPEMLAKMEAGVREAETAIIRYYDDKQGRIDTEALMADDSDEDSKESGCYTSDSTFQGQPVKPPGTYYFGEYVHREDAIEFAKALPHLLLTFTCSFHAENELDQQCVCPCAFKCVKPWMSKLMDSRVSAKIAASFENAKCNKKNKRFTSRSLLDHLHGTEDPIHQAVYVYVKHIYKNFYANDLHHETLYRMNSPSYKRAMNAKLQHK